MDMRSLFGRNVKRLREEKGLTQEEVADRSGHPQQYVSKIERGRVNPTLVTIFEIAQAMGIGHVELVQPDDVALAQRVPRSVDRKE